MMARRGYLSASRPRGTAHAAYIRAKEADSMAARASVSKNSCLITGKNAANAMRSMKFKHRECADECKGGRSGARPRLSCSTAHCEYAAPNR